MLLSRKVLQRILGALWLIDGLLQFQPQMFTMNMVNGIMKPMLTGQPGLFEPSLQFIVTQTTLHLTAVNLLIGIVQVCLGLGFLLLPDRWVKELVIASIVWAFIVWYGGEGMNMLFTGTASILTGAPGAVLLYPLLGLAVYPRKKSAAASGGAMRKAGDDGLLSRGLLRYILAGFWLFAALLQLQPNWWQPGQISQGIGAMVGQGGLNTVLVDPVLTQLSNATANIEIPLNIALIVVFLALGIGLAVVKEELLRPFLIASIVVSVVFWYVSEAFGMILTGMATDFNSGLLVVVMALAVWPKVQALRAARAQVARDRAHTEESGTAQRAKRDSFAMDGEASHSPSTLLGEYVLRSIWVILLVSGRWFAMRIRPFFWILLVFVCMGVLTLAATVQLLVPARLSVQLAQPPTPETPTTLLVQVTDEQGLTVDGAQISSQAWMITVTMQADGFLPTHQTLLVQVQSTSASAYLVAQPLSGNGSERAFCLHQPAMRIWLPPTKPRQWIGHVVGQ